jgi:DNA polymerase IV
MAQQRLARDGLHTVGDLARSGERELSRRCGAEGARLARLSCGFDDRPVKPDRETKSVSAETTFDRDIVDLRPLELHLWQLCERVSARLKCSALAGRALRSSSRR